MSEPILITHYDKKLIDINDFPVGNPIVINTIQLLSLSRRLDSVGGEVKLKPSELSCLQMKPQRTQDDSNDYENISRYLSADSIRKLLRRSIVLMLTHEGFHQTSDSIIEILTELTEDYVKKFSQTLRLYVDTNYFRGENDFIDPMNRVLSEMRLDMASIQQYESNLRSYRNKVHKDVTIKLAKLRRNRASYQQGLVSLDTHR